MMRAILMTCAATLMACGGGQAKQPQTTAPKPHKADTKSSETAKPPAETAGKQPTDFGKKALAGLTEFGDKMCACQDVACVRTVKTKFEGWGKSLRSNYSEDSLRKVAKPFLAALTRVVDCHNLRAPKAEWMQANPGSPESDKMQGFADAMCACKDPACAQATHKRLMEWVKQHFKSGKRKGTKQNVERWKQAQKKLNKCYIDMMRPANKAKPPATNPSNGAAKIRSFADAMCACKDVPCAKATHNRMMEWIKHYFQGGKRKGTKENVELWKSAQQRLNKCYVETVHAAKKAKAGGKK